MDNTSEIYLAIEDIHRRLHRLSETVASAEKSDKNDYDFQYLAGKQISLCHTARHIEDQLIQKY